MRHSSLAMLYGKDYRICSQRVSGSCGILPQMEGLPHASSIVAGFIMVFGPKV